MYLRARYYDPGAGQFVSVDRLRDVTGTLYGYSDGNPVMFVDPLGLYWLEDASDWTAGFGDTLTFGLTRDVRNAIFDSMGDADVVNYDSDFYTGGQVGGALAGTGTIAFTGTTAAVAATTQGVAGAYAGRRDFSNGNYASAASNFAQALPGLGTGIAAAGRANAAARAAGGPLVRSGSWWGNMGKASGVVGDATAIGSTPFMLADSLGCG